MPCRLQALRDTYVPALQRKADSLDADSMHDTQRLEELQADYALLEHELQVGLTPCWVNMLDLSPPCCLQQFEEQEESAATFWQKGKRSAG